MLPTTVANSQMTHEQADKVVNEVATLISGFLDDGQLVAIYAFMIRKIITLIGDPGLKILFEPKTQRAAKCGDLLLWH